MELVMKPSLINICNKVKRGREVKAVEEGEGGKKI